MAVLSHDALVLIFQRLPVHAVSSASLVCKSWKHAAAEDAVWSNRIDNSVWQLLELSDTFKEQKVSHSTDQKSFFRKMCTEGFFIDSQKCHVCLAPSSGCLVLSASVDRSSLHLYEFLERNKPVRGSRFGHAAFLQEVQSFEVFGVISLKLPPGEYSVQWRLALDSPNKRWSMRQAMRKLFLGRSFQHDPASSFACVYGHAFVEKRIMLSPENLAVAPRFSEIEVGRINIEGNEENCLKDFGLSVRLCEVGNGFWSSGLFMDAIVLRQIARVENLQVAL